MATQKSSTPRKSAEPVPQVTPLPFPGESPTVSLALAAGRMYGLSEEDQKPESSPQKRKAAPRKKAATPKKKAVAPKKKVTAPKRKAAAKGRKPK
jgi:hypothetical protein